ncbi:Tripartite-type tricarboxylate transporter, receptor component TctC [Noviherbaspirillum humi]|uniref:Tripartite-type tricarboxylate transporter, receptor component TctC n=1 Tax=Noviherbaspirillum humi TaxID=1688639 RepID=A0A239EXK0_9BURK|nr:tripartite tricarboxylate transporter substrate binding protein [Noviherbaspirillum humi]SNS48554.1 Tripartite-type tricarboxylate transporter, receptor component TctC [Noviherbaspirillum humi]
MPKAAPSLHRRRLLAVLAGASLIFSGTAAHAQATAYPNKPIKLVVGFAPGGGSDFIARIVAKRLQDKLGQPVIVENRPGAGGNLGAEVALKSPGDGYTLFLAAASYTVNASLYKLGFDPVKDMTPIAQLARGPFIIAVNPQLPVNSLKDLVAAAKKEPNKIFYASAGNGSITHIVSEYFLATASIEMSHVPYKGTAPALTDTIAGQTQVVFGTPASTLPFVKSGQLKALAVSTPSRLPALPNVPTVKEAGFPTYEVTNWHGIIGPKGIPADIVAKLNKAINESLNGANMETQLESDGLKPASGTPEEFGALIGSEIERWGKLVKARGIRLD